MKIPDKAGKGKQCVICGKYFCPDRRVMERQQTCGPSCSRLLKVRRDRTWRRRNPDYFLADSRNGVEHPVRKRGGVLQVQITAEKAVKSASADIGVRFLLHEGNLQVQIPPGISVIRAPAGAGAVFSGG